MPYVTAADGVHLHYRDIGTGSAIVFLHGWGSSSNVFSLQLTDPPSSHRAIALDFRGHGRSDDVSHADIARLGSDVGDLLDALDLRNVLLVGWSMGAMAAWHYLAATGTARTAGLLVVEMAAWLGDPFWAEEENTAIDADYRAHLHAFVTGMLFAPDEATVARLVQEGLRIPPGLAKDLNRSIAATDMRSVVGELALPSVYAYSRNLHFFTTEQEEDTIGRANPELVFGFTQSKHCPFLDEADLFNSLVQAFRRRLDLDAWGDLDPALAEIRI